MLPALWHRGTSPPELIPDQSTKIATKPKMEEQWTNSRFCYEYRNSSMMFLTESWLREDVPDSLVDLEGFLVYEQTENLPQERPEMEVHVFTSTITGVNNMRLGTRCVTLTLSVSVYNYLCWLSSPKWQCTKSSKMFSWLHSYPESAHAWHPGANAGWF